MPDKAVGFEGVEQDVVGSDTVVEDELDEQRNALNLLLTVTLPRNITSTHLITRKSVLSQLLRNLQLPTASLLVTDQVLLYIFQQLVLTVPRYQDSHSIKAVLDVISAAFVISHERSKHGVECSVLLIAVKLLSKELSSSLYINTLFSFSKWTTILLKLALNASLNSETSDATVVGESDDLTALFASSPSFCALLTLQVNILDWIESSAMAHKGKNKLHFAVNATNALTRSIISCGKLAPRMIMSTTLASAVSDVKDASKFTLFIGVCIAASKKLHCQASLQRFKDPIIQFFTKHILVSKTIVPTHHLTALRSYIADYVDEETYTSQLLTASDRLLLRSPEVAIKVLDYFTRFVEFDVGKMFIEKFADSLLNQLKSTNETIRTDAIAFYNTLLQKTADTNDLIAVVDIISKAMTAKSPLPEHRVLYYFLLNDVPQTSLAVSEKIILAIPTLLAKETNEPALAAALSAFGTHFSAYISSSESKQDNITTGATFLIKGIKDVKSTVRRAYLYAIKALLNSSKDLFKLGTNLSCIITALITLAEKVQAAGIALLDPKKETPFFAEACMSVQFIITTMQQSTHANGISINEHLEKANFFENIVALSSSKAFLFNERFYSKLLISSDEQLSFLEIITAILCDHSLYDAVVKDQNDMRVFANAMVWVMVNSAAPIRHQAISRLTVAVANDAKVLERAAILVRLGLGHALTGGSNNTATPISSTKSISSLEPVLNIWNDKPNCSSAELAQRALIALYSVLPTTPAESAKSVLESALLDLAVIASLPMMVHIHGADLWVRLCFRCGLDPRSVLESRASTHLTKWLESTHEDSTIGGIATTFPTAIRTATMTCMRLMTEVAADIVLPIALPYSLNILSDESLDSVTSTDVLIHATPSNQLFDDPIAKRQASAKNKANTGGHGSAEDKWERELKKEIEAKRVQSTYVSPLSNPKLSKADRELCIQQFALEAGIRAHVDAVLINVTSALDVLEAALEGIEMSIGDEAREAFGRWTFKVLQTLMMIIHREMVNASATKKQPVNARGVLAGSRAIALYFKLVQVAFGDVDINDQSKLDGLGDKVDKISGTQLAACILRCIGVDNMADYNIPKQLLSRSLTESIRSILESLSMVYSAYNTMDASAFTVVFPLIESVIHRQGCIAQMKEKTHTELVMTSSDVLLTHCAIESNSCAVPRQSMAKCLVKLLEEFPRLRTAARGGLLALTISAAQEDDNIMHEDDDLVSDSDKSNTAESVTKVLLDGLLSNEAVVRESVLEGLGHLSIPESIMPIFDTYIWLTRSDSLEVIQASAIKLWEDVHGADAVISSDLVPDLVGLTIHSSRDIRLNAGQAICKALCVYTDNVQATLDLLYELYEKNIADPLPEYDSYGMVIPESLNKPDEWEARSGIAHALKACVPVIVSETAIQSLFVFLIDTEALGDRNSTVQRSMLDAGLAAVNMNGKEHIRSLLDKFDAYLSRPAKADAIHDRIREAIVILLGTVAQHLEAEDPRIPEVVGKLIDTLQTPSELVQVAVSECLPPLVKVNRTDLPKIIAGLLDQLFNAPKYGMRRGAAYGLAGIVKGCGIVSLKDFNIMSSLKLAVEDKKNATRREGALFAYETLSYTLGRLFEPYIIQILPYLLVCYGDSNKQVRDAVQDTSSVIMSKLSAHCVKLVLPSLLNGLADKAWRTKTGSIEVMASMSALAPKQLSQSLPMIVPSICDALADSHQRVQEAAKSALVQFGNVIKNPEIQELVPMLISALVDPNSKTHAALSALLDTTFVHYIDAPSLALLVPIIHRGMKERSGESKKKGSQIMGNMSTLTDQRDLVPYLSTLVPTLKEVLVDPVPEIRATAASAFGSIIAKLGEDNFPGLVAELLQTLKSDTSPADRSGAAQGLSEILCGLGLDRLEAMLPEILNSTSSNHAYVREGFMILLMYLPATFGEAFTPYIAMIIPAVLQGLADEAETVRGHALHAGKVIVRGYAKSAVNLLLPELERGLFDANWRIRQNSMQLLGDLLFRIAGVSSKIDLTDSAQSGGPVDQEEGLGTEQGRQALKLALGSDRYQTVLAGVYIIRGDSSAIVRQTALHVWKSIVSNTPRTLKEILSCIMKILITSLASPNLDKRGVAARTLGDLVRKMGEGILVEIIPILETGLESDNADMREGVCVGMTEIMATAGKTHSLEFVTYCTPLVKIALVDSNAEVREAAAQTFDVFYQHLGNKVIDDILPSLLADLKVDSTGYALEALKELMAVRSNVIFPVLIPTLIVIPMTKFNAQALGSLIGVAGSYALNRRLPVILPALMQGLHQGDDAVEDVRDTLGILMHSIDSKDGVHSVLSLLLDDLRDGDVATTKQSCAEALTLLFEGSKAAFDAYIPDVLQLLIGCLAGSDGQEVMLSCWQALDALVKRIKKDDMERFVHIARRGIRDAELCLSVGEDIPGFNLPKGISPLLAIFLQGLMYGSIDAREQSALGLGEIISRTSEVAIKPFVTQITGPLIRVIGDRFPPSVKSAILQTMATLLHRVPAMLKPFLPQLQRTFVKSLSDASLESSAMRNRAAKCLTLLIPLQARLDPLVIELVQSLKSGDGVAASTPGLSAPASGASSATIRLAIWEALYGFIISVATDKREMSEASKTAIRTLLLEGIDMTKSTLESVAERDIGEREAAAKCFGAFCRLISISDACELIKTHLIAIEANASMHIRHTVLVYILRTCIDAPQTLMHDFELAVSISQMATRSLVDDKSEITDAAVYLSQKLVVEPKLVEHADGVAMVETLIDVSLPGIRSTETRREAIIALESLAKKSSKTLAPFMSKLVPALMVNVRDRTIPIKLAAEQCLIHAFQLKQGKNMKTLETYLATLDGPSARSIGDYARRVLVKISERDSHDDDVVY
ncbi:translational activator of GCN4 [Batrachochytrium dendrobatidis]|nr:translational activator of GCN4 [Batrachochytrium dendrobatidis]